MDERERPNLSVEKLLGQSLTFTEKSFHSLNYLFDPRHDWNVAKKWRNNSCALCFDHQLHNKLWKPTLASRAAQKNGIGELVQSYAPLQFSHFLVLTHGI
ncbi:hypothetical protein TNCV_3632431 [Trichonephila clavipes]|nr:hypothetical protein TNCV_3632431 [Trichonephila clavipes]